MAYISKEEASLMKQGLRYVFPSKEGWKVGFRNENNSTASVTLYRGLFEHEGRDQLNPYNSWNDDKTDNSIIFKDIVNEVLEVSSPNYNNSDIQTDYFDVGYYVQISLGKTWDNKPYEYNPKTELNWDKVRARVKKFAVRNELKK